MQELRFFLCDHGCASLFIEYERHNDLLPKSKSLFLEKLVLFIQHKYENASRSEIENVCKSAVQLFDCFKCVPSQIGGIVSEICLYFDKFEFGSNRIMISGNVIQLERTKRLSLQQIDLYEIYKK